MKRPIKFITGIVYATSLSTGAMTKEAITAYGVGTAPCPLYIDLFHKGKDEEFVAWASGYLTGFDRFIAPEAPKSAEYLNGIKPLMALALSECETNPNQDFAIALDKAFISILLREKEKIK
jgi:hypothetical protein